jgi:hypothetical protein
VKIGAIALRRSFDFLEQEVDFWREVMIELRTTVKQEYGNQNIAA